jgi:hypothetical protein
VLATLGRDAELRASESLLYYTMAFTDVGSLRHRLEVERAHD